MADHGTGIGERIHPFSSVLISVLVPVTVERTDSPFLYSPFSVLENAAVIPTVRQSQIGAAGVTARRLETEE